MSRGSVMNLPGRPTAPPAGPHASFVNQYATTNAFKPSMAHRGRMRTPAALAMAVILLAPLALAEGGRVDESEYVGGASLRLCNLGASTPLVSHEQAMMANGVAAACFLLDGTESTFALTVVDDVIGPMPALLTFWDANDVVFQEHTCDGTMAGEVPEGAVFVEVMIHGPTNTLLNCFDIAPATTGTIRLAWS